jgi:two-component system cell cycle sensor histidine kinase/response regulator CckA
MRRLRRLAGLPLRAYFALLLVLFAVAAGLAVIEVEREADQNARRTAVDEASFAARTAARQLGEHLVSMRDGVRQLAANPQIAKVLDNPRGCSLSYEGITGRDRGHLDILRSDGSVACSSRRTDESPVYGGSAWLRRALARPAFLAPVRDDATGTDVAITTVPIAGGRGLVAGFADLTDLGQELASLYDPGGFGEFLVTTADGRSVVARSIDPGRWIGASIARTVFARSTDAHERADLDGNARLYGSALVPGTGWQFFVGEDKAKALSAATALERRQLEIVGAGLLGLLLVAWLVYRNLVAPIRRLGRLLHTPEPDVGTALRAGGPAELVALSNAIGSHLAERQRAESELRRSEEQYRLLFENNPNPMWIYDTETLRFLAVNEAAVGAYGYTTSEFAAMTIEEIRPPSDIPKLHENVAVTAERNEALHGAGVWRHRRKDGRTLLVEVVSHTLSFAGRPARFVLARDVTASVEAESALRESENRYRELVENASDLIATVDLERRLTSVNGAFAAALGYSREELIGRPISELVPDESHADLDHTYHAKVGGSAAATVYEHDLIARDGRRIAVEVASRLIEEDGEPVGIQAICRDVSARREAERAQRLIAAIVESSDDAIVSRKLDGTVVSWNAGAERLFGYTAEEMIGRRIDVLVPAGSDELPQIFELLRRGERVAPFETRRLHKDGRVIDVSSTIAPLRDENGEIYAAAAISRDVSGRKQAERAFRELAAIVESSDDAIVSTAVDGTILTWNRGAERIYGYAAGEVVGRNASLLEPDEKKGDVSTVFARLGRGELIQNVETVHLTKDGSPVHVSLSASPIRNDAGDIAGASVIVRDIGERVSLEAQLRQSQKMEAIGRLAGGIAHDFNNLLTVISGYTNALLEESDGRFEGELVQIEAAAQRAAILTGQLLAFSRQQVLQPRLISMNDVVEGITPMLTRLIGSDVDLVVALDPSLPAVVADPNQIEQVLLNLVVNARDAMPSGGTLTIETGRTDLDADYAAMHPEATVGPHAMIAVSDTGVGMDAETVARAFDPFFTSKPVGVGTGLGLSTVHGIVKQSGGSIWVYSEEGLGSSFKVYLPVSDKAAASRVEAKGNDPAPTGVETILVVEDEDAVRVLTARTLELYGYSTVTADGPAAALEVVAQHAEPIDLLLTDLVMPGMSGRELAEQIRARLPRIGVVFMSGYAGTAAAQDGLLGASGYVQKPFSAGELAQTIREVLDHPADEARASAAGRHDQRARTSSVSGSSSTP